MKLKSFFQIFIIVFLMILSLSTCFIQINTLMNKYRDFYSVLYKDKQNYDFNYKICHNGRSIRNNDIVRIDISNVKRLNEWINPFSDFLYISTIDKRNFTNFIKPYNNSLIEIWHDKECSSEQFYVLREKVIKLVNNVSRCPNEADFLFQSHIYCMIKNFLNEELSNGELSNCYNELTKITNLFFIAEKHQVNIITRIELVCDSSKKYLKNYLLSVVKIPEERKKNLIDDIFTQNLLKKELFYTNNTNANNEIKNFDPKNYKCYIMFYINEERSDDALLNFYRKVYSEKAKEEFPLNKNNTIGVIIAGKEILNYSKNTSDIE